MLTKKTLFNAISSIVFLFLIFAFVYATMVIYKSNLIRKLESTKIENVKTYFEDEVLHISFDIEDTHTNAAMYIFVRDEKGEPYYDPTIINTFPFRHPFSDEFMKIQNGKNMATINVANFSSQNVYLIMYIKPYYNENWSSEDFRCTIRGVIKKTPGLPKLSLCQDARFQFPYYSKTIKE